MGFVHLKGVLKCLIILMVKLLTMVLYFYKKTHSSEDAFNERRDDFKGEVFFRTAQQVLAM